MPIKSVKMKISKNKKSFFLMSQGSLNPKIRFLGQKVCPVARGQTDTHESDYCGHCGHPFRRSFSFNLSSRIGPIMQMAGYSQLLIQPYFFLRSNTFSIMS